MKGGIKVLKRIMYKQSWTTSHIVSTDPQNYRCWYSSCWAQPRSLLHANDKPFLFLGGCANCNFREGKSLSSLSIMYPCKASIVVAAHFGLSKSTKHRTTTLMLCSTSSLFLDSFDLLTILISLKPRKWWRCELPLCHCNYLEVPQQTVCWMHLLVEHDLMC